MATEHKFSSCIRCFLLILPIITLSCSDNEFLAEIFANECMKETWYIFPGDNPKPINPSVIISMCHALPAYDAIINFKDPVKVKPIAHYSTHKFRIKFVNIHTDKQIKIWLNIYERLIITSIQRDDFDYKAKENKGYDHFTPDAFKYEFLRSRWNLDKIELHESHAAYGLVVFNEGQLPYSLERNLKNLSNFFDNHSEGRKLFYRIVSGRGHNCKHETKLHKLRSLTSNFNAYDRIFCDVFEYYNIPSQGYWNEADIFYLRGRFIRDDILSAFPPDSKALYYASPMITFVVLQREPVTWMFIFSPFPISLWGSIIITLFALKGAIFLMRIACKTEIEELKVIIFLIRRRHRNALEFTSGLYRVIIMSTYSGMILLGILYPAYNWTPDTFNGLNYTTNYKVCTSYDAPIRDTLLIEKFKLNKVPNDMWEVREEFIPAQYLAKQVERERSGDKPPKIGIKMGIRRNNGTAADGVFYAALMYDDKMNLWMKGREFLPMTHSFFDRIKPANDKVLAEIRYLSVAAGATRLHFVFEAIKWGFTCGVWMRYYNLEINYYKNVAPLIVKRLNTEKALMEEKQGALESESNEDDTRPLATKDLYASFVLNVIGLAAALLIWMLEDCHKKLTARHINYEL